MVEKAVTWIPVPQGRLCVTPSKVPGTLDPLQRVRDEFRVQDWVRLCGGHGFELCLGGWGDLSRHCEREEDFPMGTAAGAKSGEWEREESVWGALLVLSGWSTVCLWG